MILDIVHRKDERILEISYIKENGQKDIIKFNANRMNMMPMVRLRIGMALDAQKLGHLTHLSLILRCSSPS